MANKQGKIAITRTKIVSRIGETKGPIAGTGVAKRGYGSMSTQKPGKANV